MNKLSGRLQLIWTGRSCRRACLKTVALFDLLQLYPYLHVFAMQATMAYSAKLRSGSFVLLGLVGAAMVLRSSCFCRCRLHIQMACAIPAADSKRALYSTSHF